MTTEELMKPRYKCIADYPQAPYNEGDDHKFIEGDLLIQCNVNGAITFKRHGRLGFMSVGVPCCAHPEKYPKIFQSLRWDEERRKEDMPEYVKHLNGTCYKIDRWKYSTAFQVWFDEDHISLWSNALNPSTKEEYESYINQKQQ